jgi:hypothetical protein
MAVMSHRGALLLVKFVYFRIATSQYFGDHSDGGGEGVSRWTGVLDWCVGLVSL